MNHIQENKSKVEDSGTESRDSKNFSTITVNFKQGRVEQDTKNIIEVLFRMKSNFSSEHFHYIFPKYSFTYIDNKLELMK